MALYRLLYFVARKRCSATDAVHTCGPLQILRQLIVMVSSDRFPGWLAVARGPTVEAATA